MYPFILDITGAKDDEGGGDSWSYKTSPSTNQHPTFCRPDAIPVAQPNVKTLKGNQLLSGLV